MSNREEKISSIGRSLLNRRDFMKNAGFSTGALGLAQLLSKDGLFGRSTPRALLASHRFVRILIPTIPTLLANHILKPMPSRCW